MKRDEKIGTVRKMVQSLETNLTYLGFEQNHEVVSSFSDYVLSRFFDKFSTLSINYIRINWLLDTIKFEQSKSIVSNERLLASYLNESDIELIATVIRPLIELYLEIKSLQLSINSNTGNKKELFETFCTMIFYESNTTLNDLKLTVSKQFYDCEPRYFKLWQDNNKKEVNKLRQYLSQKNIPILKKTINKFLDVVKLTKNKEGVILGNDYLTTYALLSKKTHFSYTNIISDSISPKFFTDWCLFYFITIYELMMDFLDKTDEIRNYLKPFIEILGEENKSDDYKSQIGKVVIFDFGIAEIIEFIDRKLKVKYLASNVFEKDTLDEVPKVFVKKIMDIDVFKDIKGKYYDKEMNLYNDEKYIDFYMELMNN